MGRPSTGSRPAERWIVNYEVDMNQLMQEADEFQGRWDGAVVGWCPGHPNMGFRSLHDMNEYELLRGVDFGPWVFCAEEMGLVIDAVEVVHRFTVGKATVTEDSPSEAEVEDLQRLLDAWVRRTKTKLYDISDLKVVKRK